MCFKQIEANAREEKHQQMGKRSVKKITAELTEKIRAELTPVVAAEAEDRVGVRAQLYPRRSRLSSAYGPAELRRGLEIYSSNEASSQSFPRVNSITMVCPALDVLTRTLLQDPWAVYATNHSWLHYSLGPTISPSMIYGRQACMLFGRTN